MKLSSINQNDKKAIIDIPGTLIEVEYYDQRGTVWLTNESCAMVVNEGLNISRVRELIWSHITGMTTQVSYNQLPSAPKHELEVPDSKADVKQYSAYKIDVSDLQEADIYEIHNRFKIDDPSGCIQHASKKLLLAGKRTGGKPKHKDIQEAIDTLNRWLQLNQ